MLAFGAKAAWGQHNAHPDLSDDEAKTADVGPTFQAVPTCSNIRQQIRK
jgi:hypothetical protein